MLKNALKLKFGAKMEKTGLEGLIPEKIIVSKKAYDDIVKKINTPPSEEAVELLRKLMKKYNLPKD